MKRSFFIVSLIAIIMLSACQAISDLSIDDSPEIITYTGVIELDESTGGFLLREESGETVPVRSLSINLREYEKRKTEIKGVLGSDNVLTVEDITQLMRDDESKESYQNTVLGVSFQYPATWTVSEKTNNTIITPYTVGENELIDRISVTKFDNPEKMSAGNFLGLSENLKPKDSSDFATYASVVIGLDQLPGIKKTSEDGIRIDFYVSRDTSIYRISSSVIDPNNREKNRNIFFDMVNSFKFVAFSEEVLNSSKAVAETAEIMSSDSQAEPVVPEPTKAPETVSPPAKEPELTNDFQKLSSRGLQINMQYPKNWFWEQVGDKIHFSDKPLENGGVLTAKLSKGTEPTIEAGQSKKCADYNGSHFCLVSVGASPDINDIMDQMIRTLSAYEG